MTQMRMSLQAIGDFIDSGVGRATMTVVLVIVYLVMPVLFLLADPGAQFLPGPLTRIYSAFERIAGVALARFIFCGAWFAFGIAMYWHLVHKRGLEANG